MMYELVLTNYFNGGNVRKNMTQIFFSLIEDNVLPLILLYLED